MILSDLLSVTYVDNIVIYTLDGDVICEGSPDTVGEYINVDLGFETPISECDVLGISLNDFGDFSITIDANFIF